MLISHLITESNCSIKKATLVFKIWLTQHGKTQSFFVPVSYFTKLLPWIMFHVFFHPPPLFEWEWLRTHSGNWELTGVTENLLGQLRRFSRCFTLRDRNVGTRNAAISYFALDMSLSQYPTLRISTIPWTHFKGPSFSSLSKSLCKVEDGPHKCFVQFLTGELDFSVNYVNFTFHKDSVICQGKNQLVCSIMNKLARSKLR